MYIVSLIIGDGGKSFHYPLLITTKVGVVWEETFLTLAIRICVSVRET